ncbi:ion channel protein [Microbacterium schleiferi]|uniref:Ion channel protein n=1 Tax=Microbacterium schleiferi TaxID=69362 RepID=A0A7S8MXD5_9MICO|nr:ion channel protein [Microbacterium schleiferi]QPE04438.1 ion channel protein [Microbacterium schleiferi]
MDSPPNPWAFASSSRTLIALSIPAALIGILSGVMLWALDEVAHVGAYWVWDALPASVGASGDSPWWIFGVLALTGFLVGVVVWKMPGHGGQDSATVELIAPPQPARVVPSIVVAVLLTLIGGVSLGPESPIIAINTALAVWIVTRLWPAIPVQLVVILTAAGTIGALFGTPVAAALVFTGALASGGGALWDKLFLPLVSAATGTVTALVLGGGLGAIGSIAPYTDPRAIDLVSASVIAAVGAAVALVGIIAFKALHPFLRRRMPNPLLLSLAGGLILGGLGALGGPLTLFKGLEQSAQLVALNGSIGWATLLAIVGIKLAALVVAASFGFRGGRVFPAIFLGVAFGMVAHALVPSIPFGLALAGGVLGFTLAIARDGWIALFVAVAMVGDIGILPIMCVAILPTWLVVARAPEMIIEDHQPAAVTTS